MPLNSALLLTELSKFRAAIRQDVGRQIISSVKLRTAM